MTDIWTAKWDQRYADESYAYGEEPNHYLKEQLTKIKPGKILFPAEGEGRNAVYAAKQGWEVSAFDISTEGQKKALELAHKNGVTIDYRVGELEALNYSQESFDVIALIYAHFPATLKSGIHQMLHGYLRKGGTIIFESFSKSHLDCLEKDEKVGGPKDIGSLFSIEEIRQDFEDYEVVELTETVIQLNEGSYHNGQGSVIRFIGRKR